MSQKHKSSKRSTPLNRLRNFFRRNGHELTGTERSALVTDLERFVANPETGKRTGLGSAGILTRSSLWEVGIGGKCLRFPKTQAEDLLSALKSDGN